MANHTIAQIKKVVIETLRSNPNSRGDDIQTIAAVWRKQGFEFTKEQEMVLQYLFNPHTIITIKREIQKQKLFLSKQDERLF